MRSGGCATLMGPIHNSYDIIRKRHVFSIFDKRKTAQALCQLLLLHFFACSSRLTCKMPPVTRSRTKKTEKPLQTQDHSPPRKQQRGSAAFFAEIGIWEKDIIIHIQIPIGPYGSFTPIPSWGALCRSQGFDFTGYGPWVRGGRDFDSLGGGFFRQRRRRCPRPGAPTHY